MKTLRIKARPLLAPKDLEMIVKLLHGGRLVAIPTETVYGLAADLFQPDAVQKIFLAKGRPSDNPLIAHISSIKQLGSLVAAPSDLFIRLAQRFWPGPLTLIAERKNEVPPIVSAHLPTIAVRMPAHPCARQIIDAVDSPLAAPSANLSGFPSPTSADDVLEDFEGCIPAVVDGGICSFGIESTVVSLIDDEPRLLRPGAIPREAIEEYLQIKLEGPKRGPVHSPGMKYRHYAPKARLVLVDSPALFQKQEHSSAYFPKDLSAKNLYSHLRKADRQGFSEIVIMLDQEIRSDEALMNRLHRATIQESHG